jgi:hypothetical protein
MSIRIDKCVVFGAKKTKTRYVQFSPSIYIDGTEIPCLPENQTFTYLGRKFSLSNLALEEVKNEVQTEVRRLMEKINATNLKAITKIGALGKILRANLSFYFNCYDLGIRWVDLNIQSDINNCYRSWLQLPVSANSSHIYLPVSQLGLNATSLSTVYKQSRAVTRCIL